MKGYNKGLYIGVFTAEDGGAGGFFYRRGRGERYRQSRSLSAQQSKVVPEREAVEGGP